MQNPNFREIKNSNYTVIYNHAYYINVECCVLRVEYLTKVIS